VEEIARSTNMFDWIGLINDFFDEKFLEYNGEDAYMYFYFMRKVPYFITAFHQSIDLLIS